MRSIWKDLLFLHGHITDPSVLESAPAAAPPTPGNVVQWPTALVRKADIDNDPAIFAKAWQECA